MGRDVEGSLPSYLSTSASQDSPKAGFLPDATMGLSYVLTVGCQATSIPSTLSPAFYIETKKVSRHYQMPPRNKWTLGGGPLPPKDNMIKTFILATSGNVHGDPPKGL